MERPPQVDVLIVCALHDEWMGVRQVVAGGVDDGWTYPRSSSGWRLAVRRFHSDHGRIFTVAAAWCSEMGGAYASVLATELVVELNPTIVAMTGICAGRRSKVRLGDVIFADRVWKYDAGKESSHPQPDGSAVHTVARDPHQYRLGARDKQAIEVFQKWWRLHRSSLGWLRDAPVLLEAQTDWALLTLGRGLDPKAQPEFRERCPDWGLVLDRLRLEGWVATKAIELTAEGADAYRLIEEHLVGDTVARSLHMAALGSVLELDAAPGAPLQGELETRIGALCRDVIDAEVGAWTHTLPAAEPATLMALLEAGVRVLAAVTLRRGIRTADQLARVVDRLARDHASVLAGVLRRQYPTEQSGRIVAPLEPDLLGAALVRLVLRDEGLRSDVLETALAVSDDEALEAVFTVLSGVEARFGGEAAVWIDDALRGNLPARAPAAFEAALGLEEAGSSSKLGRQLADALTDAAADPEQLEALRPIAKDFAGRIPEGSYALEGLALWVLASLPAQSRPDPDAMEVHQNEERARKSLAAGDPASARVQVETALEGALRAPGGGDSGRVARIRALAGEVALAQADARGAVGLLDRAIEVLVELPPRTGRDFELARAHVSRCRAREQVDDPVGAREDASRAVRLLRGGQGYASEELLADASLQLSRLSRAPDLADDALEAARNALSLYRKLADLRPAEHRANLAAALITLARLAVYGETLVRDPLSKKEAASLAQEAVDLLRGLDKSRPGEFGSDLALAREILAQRLVAVGRPADARRQGEYALKRLWGFFEQDPRGLGARIDKMLTENEARYAGLVRPGWLGELRQRWLQRTESGPEITDPEPTR